MAIIVLAVLLGVAVFIFGLVMRKRKIILLGSPAALLLVLWFVLASLCPNPQKEFDRLFGASNRNLASDIQTLKPTLMDGHFICFQMKPADFDAHIRPQFTEIGLASPPSILLGQTLPDGWPEEVETMTSVLHREVDYHDVYLLYIPSNAMAYASVRYDQW